MIQYKNKYCHIENSILRFSKIKIIDYIISARHKAGILFSNRIIR